ncbi:MAG: glucosamine-6-phosphate deaminase [Clostridia bacterium]|nr:glucosamine-6-phosphate deaminase [Clostridia bacterium]
MRVIVCENYDEVSKEAAKIVASEVILKPNAVLGLATGSTPVGMYKLLAEMNKNGEIDFKDVKSFNLDEYYPMSADNDQSYRYFMNENLFNHINIDINNTHVLNGLAKDPEKECADFDKMIDEAGGIDLQVLGIGQNGHIAFNEPDSFLYANTHITDLTESTINANARFFEKIEDVPTQALTMGIASILKAKRIIILATGSSKKEVINDLINGEISTNNPASMLKVHKDVILICDKEAYDK